MGGGRGDGSFAFGAVRGAMEVRLAADTGKTLVFLLIIVFYI
jgi:hypothetical protein